MKRLFDHFHPCSRINRAREKFVRQFDLPEPIKSLITNPSLDAKKKASEANYLVLDLETTGLDSEEDLILSIGWVEIIQGRIDLSTSQHMYISSRSQVKPETAVINHITPEMLSSGLSITDAMNRLFVAAQGKLLVAHGCMVEANFINQYTKNVFNIHQPPLLWLDTLRIEKQLQKAVNPEGEIDLTLSGTRARYGLPEYNSHNALVDAVATAELLLAQNKRIAPQGDATLGSLYRLSL